MLRSLARPFVLALLSAGVAAQSTELRRLRDMLPDQHHETEGVALGDLDGDGDLDLLSCVDNTFGPDHTTLQLNDGTGRFEIHPVALVEGWAEDAAIADFTGDGLADVLIAGPNRLYVGDGAGGLTFAAGALPATGVQRVLEVGDVDGDGDLDAFGAGTSNQMLFNDGAGVFAKSALPALGSTETQDARLSDLDADGDLDLARAGVRFDAMFGSSPISGGRDVLRNNGLGGFAPGASIATTDATWSVAAADFDGDGDVDLVFGTDDHASATGLDELLLNDGAANFTASSALPPIVTRAKALAAADLDGDSDVDLVIGTEGFFAPDLVIRNDGGLAFTALPPSQVPAPGTAPASWRMTLALEIGDVDGDGDLDVALGGEGPDRLWLGGPGLTLVDAAAPFPDTTGRPSTLVDVDGDGAPDLYLGFSPPYAIARNDGGGGFTLDLGAVPSTGLALRDAAPGDVDGDGDVDLLVGSQSSAVALLRNDGAGTFAWNPADTPPVTASTTDTLLGDLDGDGDPDGYVVGQGSGDVVLENDGTGVFGVMPGALPDAKSTGAACFGDLDQDGDLDLVRGLTGGVDADWLANDGTGALSAGGTFAGVDQSFWALALAEDVQGNGRLDVFLASWNGNFHLRSDGGGAFTDVTFNLPVTQGLVDLAPLDLDGDGDTDFAAQDFNADELVAFVNDGTGAFQLGTGLLEPLDGVAISVLAGDIDLDGDDDVFVTRGTRSVVLTNVRSQLARRALPRVGKPLTLDVHGDAGELWGIAFAAATTKIDLGPLGLLQLSPAAGLTVLATGTLDAEGEGGVTVALPATPTLIGATVPTQAVTGTAQPRFTNLEPLHMTDL